LAKLEKEGKIEKTGKMAGQYRTINTDCPPIDFFNVTSEHVDLWLPFGLHDLVNIMPGNIIVIGGEPDAGKTGVLLNIIKNNRKKYDVHYFNSEMGASELVERLNLFGDIAIEDWNFKYYERDADFADVVVPGKGVINIIDYLELYADDYANVNQFINEIHRKLDGAICFIAIQKNPGRDDPLGGKRALEKARLGLALSRNKVKIVKAKNRKVKYNLIGKCATFQERDGCKFTLKDDWRYESSL
jgi:hypothetical protein